MSVFKKLIQTLTPPPRRRTSKAAPTASFQRQTPPVAVLKPLVIKLINDEADDDLAVEQMLSQLKQIASQGDAYQTASQIKKYLMELHVADRRTVSSKKNRGYELVAELYLQHLWEEVDAIEDEFQPLGPGVFGGYCEEVIECLFMTKTMRKGIEVSLTIADELLTKALDSFQYKDRYFELAEQAIRSATTLAVEKIDMDEIKPRAKDRHESGKPSAPETTEPNSSIDTESVEYLRIYQANLSQIREELEDFHFSPVTPHDNTDQARERAYVRNQMHYLYGLLEIARKTDFPSFTAAVLERVGTLRESIGAGEGRETLLKAGKYYEKHGDYEQRFGLVELRRRRYRKAYDIYSKFGDSESAQRVQTKRQ